MANPKDYEYTAHSGQHYMVTHQNGRPRYAAVTNRGQQFNSPVNANAHIEMGPKAGMGAGSMDGTPPPSINPAALGADNHPGYLRNAAEALQKRKTTQSPMSIADAQS